MRVLVCGATGCVGGAVVNALRSRGHQVIEGARSGQHGRGTMHVDFMQPVAPADWAQRLSAARVDAVVNCVGILMASRQQRFERVHAAGPIELFRGAALAGVQRVVQVSALGVGRDAQALAMPYLRSKLEADDALSALPIDGAVLRPSLVYGPRSQSAALFALLASLPVISLPGRGEQRVQPLHVFELAEAIVRLLEQAAPVRGVYELGGAEVLNYRDMFARYRAALRLGSAWWLPLPMPLMRLSARAAQAVPQKVLCGDTIRLLERGSVAAPNAALALLGREPTAMARGLAVTPPVPLVDLSVRLSPSVSLMLRASLATMWLYTALISALLPDESGVLRLLERCGFEGAAAWAALAASCALNTALGVATLRHPGAVTYALQAGAIVGYTATAAWHMPELTIDHCGPLVKNVPVLMLVLLLWLAHGAQGARGANTRRPDQARRSAANSRRIETTSAASANP